MRLNEKNVASFAVCSSPVDKEGYLHKKGDLNREFQRRWFVLKGNLLFYFLRKQDREPQGVIILEACSVQVSTHGRYCFEISFDGAGTRVYILGADNDEEMQSWMKAISHASYEYLKSIVDELQRRVNVLSSSSTPQAEASSMEVLKVGPLAAGTTAPIHRPKPSTIKETSVTLQELCNPIPPHTRNSSTKIKKGVLVDISDDEAPPLPAKKKSMTLHATASTDKARSGGNTYTNNLIKQTELGADYHDGRSIGHTSSLQQPLVSPPHSSPQILKTPIENTFKPLSPPATLDRTPILQPLPVTGDTEMAQSLEAAMVGLSLDEEISNSPLHQNGMEVVGTVKLGSTEPSSYPPQSTRKLAAPLDPSKSFIEMHQDFNQAMKALNAERTGINSSTS